MIKFEFCSHHIPHRYAEIPVDEYWVQKNNKDDIYYVCKICHERKKAIREYRKMERRKERQHQAELEKMELTDNYVLGQILIGSKRILTKEDIPDELITLKRAAIRLKDKIANKRKPVCYCERHGERLLMQCIKAGTKRDGTPRYKCKKCMKIMHKEHYSKNKEKVLEKCATYRKKNPEKRRLLRQKYYMENKNVYNKIA